MWLLVILLMGAVASTSKATDMPRRTRGLLSDDATGLTFSHPGGPSAAAEAEFLFEEIFTRRAYLRHGITIPPPPAIPIVIDAGANIGLFALLALNENSSCRVLAIEPSPAAFGCLENNLSHVGGATCRRAAAP